MCSRSIAGSVVRRAAVILTLGLAVAGPAAAATPLVPRDANGHIALGYSENVIAAGLATGAEAGLLHQQGGSRIARILIQWGHVETNPGERDWHGYQEIYDAYKAAGIKVLWTAFTSPQWAASDRSTCKSAWDCRSGPAAQYRDDYGRFVRDLALRFPGAVGVEIWNEPNQNAFWRSPNPSAYAALVKETWKQARPYTSKPLVAGSVSNAQKTTRNMFGQVINYSLTEFLTGMYAAGAKGSFDAISYHAYEVFPNDGLVDRTVSQVDAVLLRYLDTGRRRLVTEVGGSTTGNGSGDARTVFSPEQQRDLLVRTFRKLDGRIDHDAMLVHTLVEYDTSGTGKHGYGVVYPRDATGAFVPKPAFCALAAEVGAGGACAPISAG